MSNNENTSYIPNGAKKPFKVGIYIPLCVDQMAAETGSNMISLLSKAGLECICPPSLTCCGAELYMAGDRDGARQLGQQMIELFNDCTCVVSCGSGDIAYMQACFGKLFHNTTLHNSYRAFLGKCYDLTDFLVNVLNYSPSASFPHKVAVMDHCRTLRDYSCSAHPGKRGLHDELRSLLNGVKGLTLLEMDDNDVCCGLGGMPASYMQPVSDALARRKVESALATGAEVITSTEMSCLLHLQSYIDKNDIPLRCIHVADILAGAAADS